MAQNAAQAKRERQGDAKAPANAMPVTGDCPDFYNQAAEVCVAGAEAWCRGQLGVGFADSTAPSTSMATGLPPVGTAPLASDVLLQPRLTLAAAADPVAPVLGVVVDVNPTIENGARTVTLRVANIGGRLAVTRSVSVAAAVHGDILVGDDVLVYPAAPELTVLVKTGPTPAAPSGATSNEASTSAVDPRFEGHFALIKQLLQAVPGLPRMALFEKSRRVAWRRLLLWVPSECEALLAALNGFTRAAFNPGSTTAANRPRALRAVDSARAKVPPVILSTFAHALVGLRAILAELEAVTHMCRAPTELALELLASPFLATAVLTLLNAAPAVLDEVTCDLQAELSRENHGVAAPPTPQQQAADSGAEPGSPMNLAASPRTLTSNLVADGDDNSSTGESLLTTCVLPLLRDLGERLQQFTESECDQINPVAARRGGLETLARNASGGLHFMLVHMRAMQARTVAVRAQVAATTPRGQPAAAVGFAVVTAGGTWPGRDRDLVVGALMRGINEALGAAVPALSILSSVTVEALLPSVEDVQRLSNLSSRWWSSLVTSSYRFWGFQESANVVGGAGGVAGERAMQPGVGPLEAAKLKSQRDHVSVFAPVAHALRGLSQVTGDLDAAAAAVTSPGMLSILRKASRRADTKACSILQVAGVFGQAPSIEQSLPIVGSAAASIGCEHSENRTAVVVFSADPALPPSEQFDVAPGETAPLVPSKVQFEDCAAALAVHLGGTAWFYIWARVVSGAGTAAQVVLLQEDVATAAALVASAKALDEAGMPAVAALVVEAPQATPAHIDPRTNEPLVKGRCQARLSSLLRSSRAQALAEAVHAAKGGSVARGLPIHAPAAMRFPSACGPAPPLPGPSPPLKRLEREFQLKPAPLPGSASGAFKSAAVKALRAMATDALKANGRLTPQQDDAISGTLLALANPADVARVKIKLEDDNTAEAVTSTGIRCRSFVGGPGTGKTAMAVLAAVAAADGYAVLRNGALPPAVDAAKSSAAAVSSASASASGFAELVAASVRCQRAIADLKSVQRATGATLVIEGARLIDGAAGAAASEAQAVASRISAPTAKTFALHGAVEAAAAAAHRAPLIAQAVGPRVQAVAHAARSASAVLRGAGLSSEDPLAMKRTAAAWLLATLPSPHIIDILKAGGTQIDSSSSGGDAAASSTTTVLSFDSVLEVVGNAAERAGLVTALAAAFEEVTSSDDASAATSDVLAKWRAELEAADADDSDGALNRARRGLIASLTYVPAPPESMEAARTGYEAAASAAARLQPQHSNVDCLKVLPTALSTVGIKALAEHVVKATRAFAWRAGASWQGQLCGLELAFMDAASGIATAQILGGNLGHCAVASAGEALEPIVSSALSQWQPRFISFDDADQAPDALWEAPFTRAANHPALRTQLGRLVHRKRGAAQTWLVACSRTMPTLRTSVHFPANAGALTTESANAPGALPARPWCNAAMALVGYAANAAASTAGTTTAGALGFTSGVPPIPVGLLPEGPLLNRHTPSADIAMAICPLTATSGSLDENADDAAAVGAAKTTTHAPGFGGSAFMVTYNDVAAHRQRRPEAEAWCHEAIGQIADAVRERCETTSAAVAAAAGANAPVADLTVRRFDCYANGAPAMRGAAALGSDPDFGSAIGENDGYDFLIVAMWPSTTADDGSCVVARGDRNVVHDQRELARIASRARRAVIVAAPLSAVNAWPYLGSFAEVTRQLLSFREANWLLRAVSARDQQFFPALPLECLQHGNTKAALLVTLAPAEFSDEAKAETHGGPVTTGTFVKRLGLTDGCASACKSKCLRGFTGCSVNAHRCLAPCHAMGYVAPDLMDADDDDDAAVQGVKASVAYGPDLAGEHSTCPYPCPRKLGCGHQCTKTCGDICGGCPHEVLVERECGVTVISGFANGKPTFARMPHFAMKPCSGTAAERDAEAVETALGPCHEPGMGQCTRCSKMYPCPCNEVASRALCHDCESLINELMTKAQIEAFEAEGGGADGDAPGSFDVMSLLYQTCLMNNGLDKVEPVRRRTPIGGGAAHEILNGELPEEEDEEDASTAAPGGAAADDDGDGAGSDSDSDDDGDSGSANASDDAGEVPEAFAENATSAAAHHQGCGAGDYDFDDDDDGGLAFIPDMSMQLEALSAFVATAPESVRSGLEVHWKRETIRNTLLAKKTALEASTNGPEANPVYKAELERVEKSRAQKQQVADAIAASERKRAEALVKTVQTALKGQVDINADIEVQTRAVTDAVRQEVDSIA